MTRLTNNVRDQIVRNAIAKTTIGAETEALQQARYALAEDFRIAALGGLEEAQRLEQIASSIEEQLKRLPDKLVSYSEPLRRSDMIYRANVGGLRINLSLDGERLCPNGIVLEGDHPLAARFHELENQEAAIKDRCDALRLKIRAVLNSVTTVKKLLDVWPEAKELLPTQLEEARIQLPAVQTASLNAELGLPSDPLDTPPITE